MHTMLKKKINQQLLWNISNLKLRYQLQRSNHLFQKDNLDMVHKTKERDQLMHLNKY
jgi:hypothetical protein